ncbi:MAG TPA: lactate utilization protein [Blastocatellia bacterium]|jgi:L-lactate dehydrogenase complex protein LldG|nr:lactate utilization protein [Blastocatellia bacterium]
MSKSAREEVLSKIRGALKHAAPRGDVGASNGAGQSLRQVGKGDGPSRADLISRFEIELGRVGGRFYIADGAPAACEYVRSLAPIGASTVVGWDSQVIREIGLAERLEQFGVDFVPDAGRLSSDEFVRKSAEAAIGVTAVDYALADTGTLVLMSGRGRSRAASLLPPIHVALVKSEQLISGLENLFGSSNTGKRFSGRDIGSAVTFITGPSRTADIELTLVVGVHGPQQLHVILLSD